MIAPYSQTARSTIWNHAERDRRRAEPWHERLKRERRSPAWVRYGWIDWHVEAIQTHNDLTDMRRFYTYVAAFMDGQVTPVPEHPPEAIDLQARYRLLQADLEFQRGETELQKTRANDLTDGLNDCRAACVEAGETEGPLNERIRRLAQKVTPAAGECPSCAALRERAEKAEAEAARWKQQWEASSYSLREYTRQHPVNPKAKLAVPRKPELEEESAGEEKETVKQG